MLRRVVGGSVIKQAVAAVAVFGALVVPAGPASAGTADQSEVQAIVAAAFASLKPAARNDVCWAWDHMRAKAITRLTKTFKDQDYSAADVKAGITKALAKAC